jgi:hypothetical protein
MKKKYKKEGGREYERKRGKIGERETDVGKDNGTYVCGRKKRTLRGEKSFCHCV